MKKISTEDVVGYIKDHVAAEIDNHGVTYYLHITDDGEIVDSCADADFSATVDLGPADYGMTAEAYAAEETPDFIYAHEVIGDQLFDQVVKDLADSANEYLEGISED